MSVLTRPTETSALDRQAQVSQVAVGVAIGLLCVNAAIHFLDAPDSYAEVAYKGLLFVANGVAALATAWGIWRQTRWGWVLGVLAAGGAFLMYIVSRTVGLPGLEVDTWAEPLG